MKEIEIIKYLLAEIEAEQNYNLQFKCQKERAELKATQNGEPTYRFWKYLPDNFQRVPRQSVIIANAKKIRQLTLKLY